MVKFGSWAELQFPGRMLCALQCASHSGDHTLRPHQCVPAGLRQVTSSWTSGDSSSPQGAWPWAGLLGGLCTCVSGPVTPKGGHSGGGPPARWAGGAGGAGGRGQAAGSPALPADASSLCGPWAAGWEGHTQHRLSRTRQGAAWTWGAWLNRSSALKRVQHVGIS